MSTTTPPQEPAHHFQTCTGSHAITPMALEMVRKPPTTVQEQAESIIQSQPEELTQAATSRASSPREEAEALVKQFGYLRFDCPFHCTYQVLNNTRRQYEAGTFDGERVF